MQAQRRNNELRKSEAVSIVQEEQTLDEQLRKCEISHKLEEQLQRADKIRHHMLESYLRRLRYDNYLEQIVHEENFRETQEFEKMRKAQLKDLISQKNVKTEQFIENKRKQNNEMKQKAKISASLRELIRSSVTPDGVNRRDAKDQFVRSMSNMSFHKFTGPSCSSEYK